MLDDDDDDASRFYELVVWAIRYRTPNSFVWLAKFKSEFRYYRTQPFTLLSPFQKFEKGITKANTPNKKEKAVFCFFPLGAETNHGTYYPQ